jgi:uncharacterized protein with ParB-like and HNH nuclease domain
MKASETKLQPIIEGTKQYVVPLFQRSYSWEKKEWEILWNDLVELCFLGNPRTHFIGSIVTMPTESVPEGVAKYLLIDGQQRLTTIFILLALLRDKARQGGQGELAEEINNTLLVNPYKRDLDYYKLQPTQSDRNSFQSLVQSKPLGGQDQIANAYLFFERKLKQSGIDSQTLKKIISSNLSVVSIVLDPDDDPHLVFESLNAKGRPLTQADLIRNYFFMRIHVDDQEAIYGQYWKPMQDGLDESLTEFVRHYLMKSGQMVNKNDVYFSLKELISQGNALECLKDLACFAEYYRRLIHPESEMNPDIRQALTRINRLEVTTAYPFLLNCYSDYHWNKKSAEGFLDILNVIENFIIRRFVCNVPTDRLKSIFPPLYSQIQERHPQDFQYGVRTELQSKGYRKDIEFSSRLMDGKLYGPGERALKTKLILETIDRSYGHKEAVSLNDLTIEHVMPQTLTEWWQKHLGDEWEEVHELHLHNIGNLTLTAYNPDLSNDSFQNKKDHLATSHVELNRYFRDMTSWTKEDIEKRSKLLAETALRDMAIFRRRRSGAEGARECNRHDAATRMDFGSEIRR